MSDRFVSRGGEKLQGALDEYHVSVQGRVCADFGCNVGGFTDCLLQGGATKVYAIDTGYGELAWTLRKDPRVVVMERTNALYCDVSEAVDLVVVDVAWTPQRLAIPSALRWLKDSPDAGMLNGPLVISLLKPHYEVSKITGHKPRGPLSAEEADAVCRQVCQELEQTLPCRVLGVTPSVLLGKGGNREYLLLLDKSIHGA